MQLRVCLRPDLPMLFAVYCARLALQNFRSYPEATFTFTPRLNLIHGPNGAGKTNILEALYYLGLTKSFLTSTDAYAVRQGTAHFDVSGVFEGQRRGAFRARLRAAPGEGKNVWINGAPLETLAEMVGRIPLVLMAPQDYLLTSGPPDERRRFLNNLLSQAQPVYLNDLMRYNRALRQRNELLASGRRRRGVEPALLDSWTDEVAVLGARIVATRIKALDAFRDYLHRAYVALGEAVEVPGFQYVQAGEQAGETEVEPALRARFARARRREVEGGRTLVGPHRDELVFYLDDMEVRRYASQGQHRTFGIALRLAQFFYLRDVVEEMPLLLLDDLFGSLDKRRIDLMETLLLSDEVGQVIITHTDADLFSPAVEYTSAHQALRLTASLRDAPVID